jgi:hypothetical protein
MDRVEHIGEATPLHIHIGRLDEANELVKRFHYSRRPPGSIQTVTTWHESGGLFGDYGRAVAACYFSIPPTRWSKPVWELSRLVRAPCCAAPLTSLISSAINATKKRSPGLFVSFADPTFGHHGGVYQAASWNYAGKRERRMDGVIFDGRFIPGRSANRKWGTMSPSKLMQAGISVVPHYDEGKHLYYRATNKAGERTAHELRLAPLPYPKPAKQETLELQSNQDSSKCGPSRNKERP